MANVWGGIWAISDTSLVPPMSGARAAARYSWCCLDTEDIVVFLREHADIEHLERLEYPKIRSESILGLCGYLYARISHIPGTLEVSQYCLHEQDMCKGSMSQDVWRLNDMDECWHKHISPGAEDMVDIVTWLFGQLNAL